MISSVPSPMRAGANCMRIPRPDAYLSASVGSLPTIGAFRTSFASEEFPTCACRQLSRICGTDRWPFDHEEAFSERLFVVNFGLNHLLGAYCYLIILAQGKPQQKRVYSWQRGVRGGRGATSHSPPVSPRGSQTKLSLK